MYWMLLLLLAVFFAFSSFGCGDDDDDEEDDEDDDDDATDDDTSDDDDDTTDDDDDATDDDDDDDDTPWEGGEKVFVEVPGGGLVMVSMSDVGAFEWTDPDDGLTKQAAYIQDVVNEAIPETKEEDITTYRFNFVAADNYDILAQKLAGDFRELPTYAQLAQGWFIQYEQNPTKFTDLKVIWDDVLGFSSFMSAKMMNGGTIVSVEETYYIETATINVNYHSKGEKGAVNLSGLPAFYDDDGALSIRLQLIVLEAALSGLDPDTYNYAFDFINLGGESLLDDYLGSDINQLPVWSDKNSAEDLVSGWVRLNAGATAHQLFWDATTGYSADYNMSDMNGGTIEVYTLSD